ncbi:hypothetical protein HPB49_013132 [Dermacentor silvarum]|uniref:Uncharacterized protein n=1 Tax=Dermacentor silvarum TaxID=543639 RepID=A0ACB8D5K5_DERSI|nr:hypothetical protein HPB49_013132 [Dermacentor silvarum]
MAETRMEDEDATGLKENEEDLGWQIVTSRKSRSTRRISGDGKTMPHSQQEQGNNSKNKGPTTTTFKNRIVKASRMPQLPQEHSKIVIRPRGGLNLSKVSTTAIGVAVIEASGLTPEQAREDVVCPNFTQNIVVVSTPDPSHAARYVRIKSIIIVETEYEVNAYETAPHTTCKGVIRRVDLRDNQATITKNIVHDFNPLALAAKRIKSTGSVIVLFDGLKCIGCGAQNPEDNHTCVPNCKFCGGDHPTGDKACQERYQIPYVVRIRRRERNRSASRATSAELQWDAQTGAKERSRSRSPTRSRRRSPSKGTSRSRSREVQVRFEGGKQTPCDKTTSGTAWADKVKGTVRAAESGAGQPVGDNDARIEQLIKEVTYLRKANEELTKQVVELRKNSQTSSTKVAIAKPVNNDNSQEEENSPAPKKRAISPVETTVCSALEEIKEAIKQLRDATDRTTFKVDKLWKWRVTTEKRLSKVEAQGEDAEYLSSEAESVRSLPGASGSSTKRTLAGSSNAGSISNG